MTPWRSRCRRRRSRRGPCRSTCGSGPRRRRSSAWGGRRRLAGPDEGPGRGGRAPLAAVCLIDRGDASGAGITALGPSAAYPGVLGHAFCFSLADPARKRLMLERYLALVARVPIFGLRVPDGLGRLPALLDEVERVFGGAGPCAR